MGKTAVPAPHRQASASFSQDGSDSRCSSDEDVADLCRERPHALSECANRGKYRALAQPERIR